MGIQVFTDGQQLTGAQMRTVANQEVIPCADGSQFPGSPTDGMLCYVQGYTNSGTTFPTGGRYTHGHMVEYHSGSSTTAWTPPWNTAWGPVQTATSTSSTGTPITYAQALSGAGALQTVSTTLAWVDITGMSFTFTPVANRWYRITGQVPDGVAASASHTTGHVYAQLTDGSGTPLGQNRADVTHAAGTSYPSNIFGWTPGPIVAYSTFSAVSTTVKGRFYTSAIWWSFQNNVRGLILVEDVGPAGVPVT